MAFSVLPPTDVLEPHRRPAESQWSYGSNTDRTATTRNRIICLVNFATYLSYETTVVVWFHRKLRLAGLSRRAGLEPSSKHPSSQFARSCLFTSSLPTSPASPFTRLTVPAHFLGRVTLGLTFCVTIKDTYRQELAKNAVFSSASSCGLPSARDSSSEGHLDNIFHTLMLVRPISVVVCSVHTQILSIHCDIIQT